MIISFLVVLTAFLIIGLSSAWKSQGTKKDYYLASSSVSPMLVGLSAVATNNSGYMFIGVIGYTYVTGLASIWLMIGWIVGDFLASMFVHSHLRAATGRSNEVSFAGVLSNWEGGKPDIPLQKLAAIISALFLLAYASAQLVAGSKALHVLLGWPEWSGAVVGAILVILYCWAGGIRASIWTDAAQSIVMMLAMGMLLFTATSSLGGVSGAVEKMQAVNGFMDLFPKDLVFPGIIGGMLFALSWGFAGLSVVGQPHVMVRFMTLNDNRHMKKARLWYYSWFTLFYCMATAVGMLAKIYLSDPANFDQELALPVMAQELLPGVGAGIVLAGIFAATMSTADSLVLSCSSAISHDLLPGKTENTRLLKAITGGITVLALIWALLNQETVFNLVIFAWSGLASAFVPLLLIRCFKIPTSQRSSIVAMIAGLGVAIGWRLAGWHSAVYEGMPGILTGLLILVIASMIRSNPTSFSNP